MFSAGTRVYVYSSSLSKKLGPKRHSVGYISSCENTFVIQNVANFPIKDQAFIMSIAKVIFTRYGKEEKERYEARDFLNIIPTFVQEYKGSVSTRVTEVLDIFNNNGLDGGAWETAASDYMSHSISACGTLIPLSCNNIEDIRGKDFTAWVTAILRNEHFTYILKTSRNLPTLNVVTDNKKLLMWAANAARSQSARRDLLRWATDDTDHMRQLVELFQTVRTIFNLRIKMTADKNMKSHLNNHGSVDIHHLAHWYIDNMFEDSQFKDKHKKFALKGKGSSISAFVTTMPEIRSTYLTLKPKYV